MSKPWFKPKRYGYGTGLPCSWEGWGAMAALFAGIFLSQAIAFALAPPRLAIVIWLAATTALLIIFAVVARSRTEGGWKWRNGNDSD